MSRRASPVGGPWWLEMLQSMTSEGMTCSGIVGSCRLRRCRCQIWEMFGKCGPRAQSARSEGTGNRGSGGTPIRWKWRFDSGASRGIVGVGPSACGERGVGSGRRLGADCAFLGGVHRSLRFSRMYSRGKCLWQTSKQTQSSQWHAKERVQELYRAACVFKFERGHVLPCHYIHVDVPFLQHAASNMSLLAVLQYSCICIGHPWCQSPQTCTRVAFQRPSSVT